MKKIVTISFIMILTIVIVGYVGYRVYNNYLATNFIKEQKEIRINGCKDNIDLQKKLIVILNKYYDNDKKKLAKEKKELNNSIDKINDNINNLMKLKINNEILNEIIKQRNDSITNFKKYTEKFNKRKKELNNLKMSYIARRRLMNIYLNERFYIYENRTTLHRSVKKELQVLYKEKEYSDSYIKLLEEDSKQITVYIEKYQEAIKQSSHFINKINNDNKLLIEKYLLLMKEVISMNVEVISENKQEIDLNNELILLLKDLISMYEEVLVINY